MAVKPVDRIRTMITELERGARTLGDDIRKRAGKSGSDIESALRQLLNGLTNIAAQLEKAAGELRRYLEDAGTAKKKATKRASARPARKKKAAKKSAKAIGKKPAAKKR
jgi:hypothetical protein